MSRTALKASVRRSPPAFKEERFRATLFNSHNGAAAFKQNCVAPAVVHLSYALAATNFAKAA